MIEILSRLLPEWAHFVASVLGWLVGGVLYWGVLVLGRAIRRRRDRRVARDFVARYWASDPADRAEAQLARRRARDEAGPSSLSGLLRDREEGE